MFAEFQRNSHLGTRGMRAVSKLIYLGCKLDEKRHGVSSPAEEPLRKPTPAPGASPADRLAAIQAADRQRFREGVDRVMATQQAAASAWPESYAAIPQQLAGGAELMDAEAAHRSPNHEP
jgi:hypothetical protein